jgi:hypothetical protein
MVKSFFGQNSSTSGSAFYVVDVRDARRCPIRPKRGIGITSLTPYCLARSLSLTPARRASTISRTAASPSRSTTPPRPRRRGLGGGLRAHLSILNRAWILLCQLANLAP